MKSNSTIVLTIGISVIAAFICIKTFAQQPAVDNRDPDPGMLLGDIFFTSSEDGKTLFLWSVRTTVTRNDHDFMNGYIKSYEIRYIASAASSDMLGGGSIAFNLSLEKNPVRIFGKAYLPGEEHRAARVEMENFLRLR